MDDFGRRRIDYPTFSSLCLSIIEPTLKCDSAITTTTTTRSISWKDLSSEDVTSSSEEEWEDDSDCAIHRSPLPSPMPPVASPKEDGSSTEQIVRPSRVSFANVAKAARAATLNDDDEDGMEELKPIFDYDNVELCYGGASDACARSRTSSRGRARRLWQRAIGKTLLLKDPWEKFNLEELPAEIVLRHRYNSSSGNWVTDKVIVKMDTEPFGHGAMRECFRLKKVSNFSRPRSSSSGGSDMDLTAASDPAIWSGSAKNYVAKRYLDKDVPRRVYFDDVKLQMDAKLWGEEFNRYSPPKPVDIFQMSLLEFPSRPNQPMYHLEHFIEGDYVKYNSNSGYINDKTLRRTPQAFSHFTFERSGHQLIVVDVQGVGDLYTDPQIHTVTGKDYGDGNLGTRGMALFFHSHACNRICRSLNLVQFDLSPVEKDDQKTLVASQKNCVTMLRGMETPMLSPIGGLTSPVRGLRLSAGSDEGYFEWSRNHADSDGISDSSSASEKRQSERSEKARNRNRLDSSLCGEDEMTPSNNFLCPANLSHRGSSVAVEIPLLNQLRDKEERLSILSQSILGQIHVDLAKYHDQGRFSEDTGRDEIDYGAILFHLEKASECSQLGATMALAAILLKFPSDVISNEIPDNKLSKFLKGDDARKRGVDLLSFAATAGDRSAMIRLGLAYECGNGLDDSRNKSWSEADRWFAQAAEMEDCDEGGLFDSTCDMPLYELLSRRAAMLTTGGFGLDADPSTAGELYSSAADAAVAAMKGRLANKFYMLAEEAWALVED